MATFRNMLEGTVALVTGASRGAGKGIALVLGEAGATVYVTGRSTRTHPSRTDLPGTIEETANEVTRRGGVGIPVRCDHTIDEEVALLYERIHDEQNGRLDLVVNNAWGGYENYDDADFLAPFWEQPMIRWEKMFHAGLRAQMVSSRYAMKILLPRRKGLIINTGVNVDYGSNNPVNVFYDTVKRAVVNMTQGMALNLSAQHTGISVIALAPGWMRTEDVCRHFGITQEDNSYLQIEELLPTESVFYIGRAVAALTADPHVSKKSGKLVEVGQVASEYDFTDIDGRRIPPFRV
ncbi:SDR family NAD(P)-dependent oxidoreductase [Paenibacillus hexagrammi]|uniref:SDR family NAD(P)-dependent oxidoreductase n=1 Tax=Paenibacillus hexagrammi TaxID=2908839 RepID=A0ABY3SR14_9BACL|nr:SDR family NAD(P)-dependent oxidoreductase [Paenibacillus sp. YPD9-1]UJF36124.1 SDR family NAD(P)-dependent oxidoreductase [Paenibacillus sp. YPD9-1]